MLLAGSLAWAADARPGAPSTVGDAQRGRDLALSRSQGLCVLCHAIPGVPPHQVGDLGPSLAGVASRLNPTELRLRLIRPQQFNPDTIMPAYGAVLDDPARRVAARNRGQALLDAQALEDVLAFLETLR
jgi:sulfur-oxidizing protein SoxX